MASIHVDDNTAKALQALAAARGMTVEEYLHSLVSGKLLQKIPELSDVEFDALVDEVATHGPTLPRNFSRADIYAEHD